MVHKRLRTGVETECLKSYERCHRAELISAAFEQSMKVEVDFDIGRKTRWGGHEVEVLKAVEEV